MSAKKGHTIKGRVLPFHPAASAAESDLLKLTREFEELRSQLDESNASVKEHHDAMNASRIDFEMGLHFRQQKIEHLRRQRRVLESQFTNVSELMRNVTQIDRDCNGCATTPLRRFIR